MGFVHEHTPSIVVLGVDNEVLAQRLLARCAVLARRPTIVAVVRSDDRFEMSACYRQGADRVVVIPFCSSRIFQALINSLQSREISYPPYRFKTAIQMCHVGDREVRLTAKRFDIAQYLFANQGKVLSKATILKDIWGLEEKDCTTRRLEVHLSQLRKQLELDGSQGWEIRSVRNMGYGIFAIAEKSSTRKLSPLRSIAQE